MYTIHVFDTTYDAYDACQSDPKVENGDILVCIDERIVGIAGTWPVAVTTAHGQFHVVEPGAWAEVLERMGADPDAFVNACSVAVRFGCYDLVRTKFVG